MKPWIEALYNFLPFVRKKAKPKAIHTIIDPADIQAPWWGIFLVEEEQSRFFKIGNLVLCFDRYSLEWRVTTYREGEQPFKNFAAQASNEIVLKPSLPDRSLLSQLDRPFYIPSGETLLLYVSSPIWIRIETGNPSILLDEVAAETLGDTWFGKNTLEGELCYAGESYCSPHLEDLPQDTTRIMTPICIENHSRETLLLRELKVPLPFLSVYSDIQNHLWTEQLNIHHENANDVETNVVKGPPLPLQDLQLLCPARFEQKPGLKNLFSPFMWK